jgi:hypothetical protein
MRPTLGFFVALAVLVAAGGFIYYSTTATETASTGSVSNERSTEPDDYTSYDEPYEIMGEPQEEVVA